MGYIHWEQQFYVHPSTKIDYPPVFAHWSYLVSSIFSGIGVIIFTAKSSKQVGETVSIVQSHSSSVTCVLEQTRSFPGSIIFFFVCSGACWFMNSIMTDIDENIKTIHELKN